MKLLFQLVVIGLLLLLAIQNHMTLVIVQHIEEEVMSAVMTEFEYENY
jgi:hypothetical protein